MYRLLPYLFLSCFPAVHLHGAASSKITSANGPEHEIADSHDCPSLIGRKLIEAERTIPKAFVVPFTLKDRVCNVKIHTRAAEGISGKSLAEVMLDLHKQSLPAIFMTIGNYTEGDGLTIDNILDLYSLLRTFGSISNDSFVNADATEKSIDSALANMLRQCNMPTMQNFGIIIIGLNNKLMDRATITNSTELWQRHTTLSLLLQFVFNKNPFAIRFRAHCQAYHLF